jgi:hypothetical protein
MFQRVRIAGRVLPGNLPKIQSQDLPSFLYASKRCSSKSDHGIFILVLERLCFSASLDHPSSSLLDSKSLSLRPPSSLLIDSFAIQEPGINGSALLRSSTRSIDVVKACLRSS